MPSLPSTIRARAIVRELELGCAPVDLFAQLASKRGPSALLESADIGPKYGERSLGAPAPALTLTVRGERWWLTANTPVGEGLLPPMARAIADADIGARIDASSSSCVAGTMPLDSRDYAQDEAARLTRRTPLDLLRVLRAAVAVEFDGAPMPLPAWIGGFSYDAIELFESLPDAKTASATDDPDLVLHYADWGFVTNHLRGGHTRVVACAFEWPGQSESEASAEQERARALVRSTGVSPVPTLTRASEASAPQTPPALDHGGHGQDARATDLDRNAYTAIVAQVKEHIAAGDVFQAVPSRSVRVAMPADLAPIDVYRTLRRLNPSPYMFFVALGADPMDARDQGVLLGASPEMAVRVSRDGDGERRRVEIRPIAGTKPRGRDLATGEIDDELDRRYEIELTTDYKELAEHVMLIDLARNDVARVCKPGTRRVDEHFVVERYSHVQHLVSNVSGELRDGLDALTAYAASMNQGTLTGAPKVEAMALLRRLEASARGFYGGAVGLYTHDGDLDTCIVIRSLRLRDGFAHARAGAGVVADSDPDSEFDETERKLAAPLRALAMASSTGVSPVPPPARASTPSATRMPTGSEHNTASASDHGGHGQDARAAGVLLIDNVDSFTYNLVDEFARLGARAHVYRNDTPLPALIEAVAQHDLHALVVSPGPGSPETAGVTCDAIAHFLGKLPLLGVCLGHQALVQVCGGTVDRAPRLVHGKASRVSHDGTGLFEGIENPLAVGRYHSLAATTLPTDGALIECAHVIDRGQRVCMAVRHRDHHAHGVQFHPESILTPLGTRLLARFLAIAAQDQRAAPIQGPSCLG